MARPYRRLAAEPVGDVTAAREARGVREHQSPLPDHPRTLAPLAGSTRGPCLVTVTVCTSPSPMGNLGKKIIHQGG